MRNVKLFYNLLFEIVLVVYKELESVLPFCPPKNWRIGEKGDIILIQGFNETWVFLKQVGNFLNNEGYRIHIIPRLGRNLISIEKAAMLVKAYINERNLSDVILIVHSKGGKIAKKLLIDNEVAVKIKKTIFIASPHKGTLFGHFHFFSLKELRPKIVEKESALLGSENLVNIYPQLDELVIPNSSLLLSGAKNICISVVGHLQILRAKETFQEIKENL